MGKMYVIYDKGTQKLSKESIFSINNVGWLG